MIFYTDVLGLLRPSISGCKAWMWFEILSGMVTHIAFELLLVMRGPYSSLSLRSDILIPVV
jgi:hypothetical protein